MIRELTSTCGAYARSTGKPCRRPPANLNYPYKGNGRCRNHGGLSTGPKTLAGYHRAVANLQAWWRRGKRKTGG
ncbi:MAG: hypothetical protein EXR30_05085 [Betaproteobacteria bacterium]|nr:hypothetical protein [Betaproteobacteria bacterium]